MKFIDREGECDVVFFDETELHGDLGSELDIPVHADYRDGDFYLLSIEEDKMRYPSIAAELEGSAERDIIELIKEFESKDWKLEKIVFPDTHGTKIIQEFPDNRTGAGFYIEESDIDEALKIIENVSNKSDEIKKARLEFRT